MTRVHVQPTDDTHERALFYALGSLSPEEHSAFEQHLADGCDVCRAELRSVTGVMGRLASSVAATPPETLRERLGERLARETAGGGESAAIDPKPQGSGVVLNEGGLLIARSLAIAWQALAPGIEFKPLFVDSSAARLTALVRMAAGARYPSHRHAGTEELYLLEGDLVVEGNRMQPGDYCRAEVGSLHGETRSETGCLFILSASQQDEVMA